VIRLPAVMPGDDSLVTRLILLAPAWMVLVVAALTPTAALRPDQGDVILYFEKAHALASGLVPYRDFDFIYPPGALLAMIVPFLAGGLLGSIDLGAYKVLFAGWEALLLVVLGLVLARLAERTALDGAGVRADADVDDPGPASSRRVRDVLLRLAFLSIGAVLTLAWRYDLFPATLVMIGVWAAIERRPTIAGIVLAVGVLAKLYPVAVVPAVAMPWLLPVDLRRLARLSGAFALTIVVGLGPFVALAGKSATRFFEYQVGHGIQIESVGGGLAVLVGLLTGQPQGLSFANSRVQVEGPFAEAWLAAVPFLTIAGFGLLAVVGWRRIRAEAIGGGRGVSAQALVTAAAASVLMVLVTSKVYSIQYVVWLLPFMALLRGRRFLLAAAVVALTIPIHPLLYSQLVDQQALPIVLLNVRNALLVGLAIWTLRELAQPPRTPAAS
jgi:hypothetical protein